MRRFLLLSLTLSTLGFLVFLASVSLERGESDLLPRIELPTISEIINLELKSSKTCAKPKKYYLAEIDPRFGLTLAEAKGIVDTAAAHWEKAGSLDLFTETVDSGLPIRFVFDSRQAKTQSAQEFSDQLESIAQTYESLSLAYDTSLQNYDSRLSGYKNLVSAFEVERAIYQEAISAWNNGPRTNKNTYQELGQMKNSLDNDWLAIEEFEKNLRLLLASVENTRVALNEFVALYNDQISLYNDTYVANEPFEAGEYVHSGLNRSEILIYQFNSRSHLELVLTHEFGHSLGIGHLDNPAAVMNAMSFEQSIGEIVLTKDDVDALREACL